MNSNETTKNTARPEADPPLPSEGEQAMAQGQEEGDEALTEAERQAVETLRLERENYDEEADLRERVEAKMQLLAENPGLVVAFEPEEAEHIGLFEETAMGYEDAWESRFDERAP